MSHRDELRESIRGSLSVWLDKLRCGGNVEATMNYKSRFVEKLRHSPVAVHTDKANKQHYEVPTAFFKTILGKRLKYSCCFWPDDVISLDRAEDAMLDLTCKRAQIQNGQTILDLGCGWGSTAFWIVEHYPRCRVTCVSNSRSQTQYITEEAQRRGVLNQVLAVTADVNVFEATGKFDRIVSIEMFETLL
jgi:cyclopropane-fatty-acyl-phospholipid synthase